MADTNTAGNKRMDAIVGLHAMLINPPFAAGYKRGLLDGLRWALDRHHARTGLHEVSPKSLADAIDAACNLCEDLEAAIAHVEAHGHAGGGEVMGNYSRDTEEGARLWQERLDICSRARAIEEKYGLPMWYDGERAPAEYKAVLRDFEDMCRRDEEDLYRWAEAGVRSVAQEVLDFVQAQGGSISFSMLKQKCRALKPWHSFTPGMINGLPGLRILEVGTGWRIEATARCRK